jgi:hypothetical protein
VDEHAEGKSAEAHHGAEPHMPRPSYWPLVASIGLPLIAYGILFQWVLIPLGAVVTLVGIYGWALEPLE